VKNLNVLLIDDEPVFHMINTKILQRLGLTRISTACNGKEALNFFVKSSSGDQTIPDAIFVDLNMPVLDGFGFIEAFARLNIPGKSKPRIAILTSSIDPRDMKRAEELGIQDYLTKPITESSVRSVLESLVVR
jgi:CheY-like chemotaxis protein